MRTTTTVLLAFGLVGCAGEDGEATAAEPGTCDGGGTLSVELGDGGRNDGADDGGLRRRVDADVMERLGVKSRTIDAVVVTAIDRIEGLKAQAA